MCVGPLKPATLMVNVQTRWRTEQDPQTNQLSPLGGNPHWPCQHGERAQSDIATGARIRSRLGIAPPPQATLGKLLKRAELPPNRPQIGANESTLQGSRESSVRKNLLSAGQQSIPGTR